MCSKPETQFHHLTYYIDDPANSVAAGAISGMIVKCTKGTKPMLISGGLVACAAGVWAVSITSCSIST